MPTIVLLQPENRWQQGRPDFSRLAVQQDDPLRYVRNNFSPGEQVYVAMPDGATPRDTVRRHYLDNPDLTSAAWHADPGEGGTNLIPGLDARYIGTYYPAACAEEYGPVWTTGVARTPVVGFPCAHCAAVAARANLRPGEMWTIVCNPADGLPAAYTPPPGELVDEAAIWTTVKMEASELPDRTCSRCFMSGHNNTTCPQKERYIDRVGIEIEGRWTDTANAYNALSRRVSAVGATIGGDGSVRRHSGYFSAEIQTKPGSPREALRQLVDFYPDHVGEDCGMHVHVSFQDATLVSTLCTREFFRFYRQKWAEFIAAYRLHPDDQLALRLAGQNDYTQPNADFEDAQERFGRIDRYRQINFAAWHEHKTVEFRLLPMFRRAPIAVAAVWHLVSLLNEWFDGAGAQLPAFADVTAGLSPGENPLAGIGEDVTIRATDLDELPYVLGILGQETVSEPSAVPEGHVRIVPTPTDYTTLQEIIRRAS